MIRRLLMLGLLAAFGWLVGRALGSGAARRPTASGPDAAGRAGGRERAGGAMVRDRVCNTFLPKADALSVRLDGHEHHFCSAACRDRFVRERQEHAGPAA